MKKTPLIKIVRGEKYYLKITAGQKIQHYILAATFILLVCTGFPLRFYYYEWAGAVIRFLGGLNTTRAVHRAAGTAMVVLFFYHWFYLFKNIMGYYIIPAKKDGSFSWRELILFIYYSPMFPRKKDLEDVVDLIKYVTFLTYERPKHERFHWKEKFDYWAVFWGIPVLGITGIIPWFPEWATSFLPGWAVNISFIAHSDEAILAVSVIFIWHMYNAHVNYDQFPMSPLFVTGYLPGHLMKEEYYLEWARINRIAASDPSRIVDMDLRKSAEELSDRQKLDMVRKQIAHSNGDKTAFRSGSGNPYPNNDYHNLGLTLAGRGDFEGAFEAFKKAGGRPRAYNNLGCIYMQKGEFDKAVAYFEKAIAATPSPYTAADNNLKKARAALKNDRTFR